MENALPSVTPISGVGDKGPACFLVETGAHTSATDKAELKAALDSIHIEG